MFSKILIKLIDESIIPALLLLVTRVVSVIGIARTNNIPFEIGASGIAFKSQTDYLFINSYSVFYMVVVVTIGLLYILTKSLIFHETHVTPATSAKLHEYKMRYMIQNSYDLYTQGSIWLSYCYLLLMVSGISVLFKYLFPWVFYVSLALSVIATILFILDVEEELIIMKKKNVPVYDNSNVKLNLDDMEEEE